MKFTFKKNKEISVLAWFLTMDKKSGEIVLEHGKNIETGDDFFVEGSWDGRFVDMEFDQAFFFCGTAGKIRDNKLILSTPNHTHERINAIETSDTLYFSNSLPFLLKRTDSHLSQNFYEYDAYFQSILDGVDKYKNKIPLAENRELLQFYYCNLSVGPSFEIVENPKNEDLHFENYEDYIYKLRQSLDRFKANIDSGQRKTINYGSIVTVSKGYDAPASAVIARKFGCDEAITFNEPKIEDCGTEIAQRLGYDTILEKNERTYLKNKNLVETEFISSGELGTGIVFSAFDKAFENKVVFMGERGDKIWALHWPDVNNKFRFSNEVFPGTSLIETRLRVGYIFYPVPLFGAFRWTEINRISRSEEMKPYRVGGTYDRPIPRRIVEEAGIPRYIFGIKKMGAGFNYRFDSKKRIKKRMSTHTFQKFLEEYRTKPSLQKMTKTIRYFYLAKEYYLNYLMAKSGLKFRFQPTEKRFSNPGIPRDLLLWSMDKMKERY